MIDKTKQNQNDNVEENVEENNDYEENMDENLEDDVYLMQLHKRFIEMKKERKKAEQDAGLLNNRLKLLKGEEEKQWKKIENTRKKTQEKVSSLQKLEEELRKKQEVHYFIKLVKRKKRFRCYGKERAKCKDEI